MKQLIQTNRSYSTKTGFNVSSSLVCKLYSVIGKSTVIRPHPGLIVARHRFRHGILMQETALPSLAVLDLLVLYAYPAIDGYSKFNILLSLYNGKGEVSSKKEEDFISFVEGKAIPFH